jgi:hypothetical protein
MTRDEVLLAALQRIDLAAQAAKREQWDCAALVEVVTGEMRQAERDLARLNEEAALDV